MGEITCLLDAIKKDKEEFDKLVDKLSPLIKKYANRFFGEEREDVNAELVLALWEAVIKIKYYDNDGMCIAYFANALRNKYYELLRKSKADNKFLFTEMPDEIFEQRNWENVFANAVFEKDVRQILGKYDGKTKQICMDIVFVEASDSQIANKYQVSRQYVNRLRRVLLRELKDSYIKD